MSEQRGWRSSEVEERIGGRGKLPSVMHCGNLFQYQSYTHWCLSSFSSLESKGNIALFHYSFTSLYFTSLSAQSANIQFGFQATLNPVSPLETCHFAELWAQTCNGQQKVHSSLQRPKPQPYRVISCGRVICYLSIYVKLGLRSGPGYLGQFHNPLWKNYLLQSENNICLCLLS